ncbi:MAG: low molecular weight protein arginine phosphatase [Caldibacillus debilis]|uniref:low molecular weight protein arginine phosphatase n=1 Tax=Caldibacillus debilis TaxID=301148 RepID=UPI000B554063|nr:low molecular weight protein arginine phosphatase [Caldibacillus debilis]MBY6272092.1 low molecular weight protein arginine phosphatase [Bacillaceae bacterium]OUM84060.1 MAG: phosphatase [Caldibacillus debilis]REJ15467.1 MAG: low molecular weight protein arginine phosphatase [Caldibacillus debilis]
MAKVLFVCTGNTCRSPMAEAILNHMGVEGIEARSAGIFAVPGMEISENAREVLKENDMEFAHVSKPLTEREIEWADLILAMTKAHKAELMRKYPHAKEKIYTIKEYATGEEGDVPDPYGGPLETYRETFSVLKEFIRLSLKKMLPADDT